jgi:integrase
MRGQGRVFRPKVRGVQTAKFWLDYSIRGVRHREPANTTSKTEAQRLLRDRMRGRETGQLTSCRPDKFLFAEYTLQSDGTRKLTGGLRWLVEQDYVDSHFRSGWRIAGAFDHLARFFGNDRALDITSDRIDAYRRARTEEGAALATTNRELSALRHAFRLAVKKGKLATRPEFTIPEEKNARQGFLEAEDADALWAELREPLRSLARFLYFTGWRKGEALTLTWANVDLAAGIVRLDVGTTKSGAGRTFPISVFPELETLLRERWAARDGLFVFQRGGARVKDFYAAWHNAVRRAAVRQVDGREVIVRPGLVGRIPHDLRRTAVRNLVRAGVSEHTAMKLTGHKTRAVFDRYDIVSERDLTDGVAKLAALHANGKTTANIPAVGGRGLRVSSGGA